MQQHQKNAIYSLIKLYLAIQQIIKMKFLAGSGPQQRPWLGHSGADQELHWPPSSLCPPSLELQERGWSEHGDLLRGELLAAGAHTHPHPEAGDLRVVQRQ